jgi:tetratricopeptide (TPR) repeat protein
MHDRLCALVLAGLFLIGAPGCAGVETQRVIENPRDLPAFAEIDSVPFFAQEQYYCGPAALAMALAFTGLPVTPDDLVREVYTPGRQGTFAADILAAARRRGRIAIETNQLNALLRELAAGHPAIVFQNLSLPAFPQWHFAVAIGYDLNERQIILRSGTNRRLLMPLDAFERTWRRADDWALIVLPPDVAPAAADDQSWLAAAAGLERVNRPQEARVAYETMLERRPGNRAAQMGRANALFASDQFAGAVQAYREILATDPDRADAWNNLAYALHRQGKQDEAVRAAERAVSIAGGQNADYADTLRDVSRPVP